MIKFKVKILLLKNKYKIQNTSQNNMIKNTKKKKAKYK